MFKVEDIEAAVIIVQDQVSLRIMSSFSRKSYEDFFVQCSNYKTTFPIS
jgi:hypothetical protein